MEKVENTKVFSGHKKRAKEVKKRNRERAMNGDF